MLTMGKHTYTEFARNMFHKGNKVGTIELAAKKKAPDWDVDSQWFFDQLQSRKLSLRGLAKLIDMSPSSLSLRLGGRYKITMEEAGVLASLLGVPFEEIVVRAGIKVPKDPVRAVRLVGQVHGVTVKPGKAMGTIDRPSALPSGTVAIKGVEPGWIYFYNPSQKLQPEAVNTLSVVNDTLLGVLEKAKHPPSGGQKGGLWDVRGVFGGGVEGVRVASATPVLMILP